VGPQKDQLLDMAATWEKLAAERSDLVRRHPELAPEGEHVEESARQERYPSSASDAPE
jgi:hypothetical protein